MIWSELFDCGKVSQYYKQTNISPLFKASRKVTGLKQATIVQLPSHIVKIYERILRVGMVRFINL